MLAWETGGVLALVGGGRLERRSSDTARMGVSCFGRAVCDRVSTIPGESGAAPFGRATVSSLEKIAARRAELDELSESLAKQLAEVDAEREELAVAERVLRRLYEHEAGAAGPVSPQLVQVAGRSVLKVPHRSEVAGASALPGDYQRMLQIVKEAGGPVMVKEVGAELGIDASAPGRLEPLRGKLSKLAGRGWLHKLPNGTFTARA